MGFILTCLLGMCTKLRGRRNTAEFGETKKRKTRRRKKI